MREGRHAAKMGSLLPSRNDMGFNPYQPPGSHSPSLRAGRRTWPGRWYHWPNYLYAAVVVAATAILAIDDPSRFDLRGCWALLYFQAPVLCFALLRWGRPAWFRGVLAGYGLYLLVLVGVSIWNFVSDAPMPGLGAYIVGSNALALAAAGWQVRAWRMRGPAGEAGGPHR